MAKYIAVAGKGGTGKTTFTALMIRYLKERQKGSILAIDADPNSNLNEALGLEANLTIAELIEQTKNPNSIPPGMPKDIFIEYKLQQSLVETKEIDMLVMGNPQGPGCYCYPNDLLRKYMDNLGKGYDYVVVDNEAGLEHISRKTISQLHTLFIISDSSARGIRSAGRVFELVKALKIKAEEIYLVVTKTQGNEAELGDEIAKTGLELIGTIPFDPMVTDFDAKGKPLFQLPADSAVMKAVNEILDKVKI